MCSRWLCTTFVDVFGLLVCSSVPPPPPRRPQRVVRVDDERAVSVVDSAAFAAAQALERDGHEQVAMGCRLCGMQQKQLPLVCTTDQLGSLRALELSASRPAQRGFFVTLRSIKLRRHHASCARLLRRVLERL